VTIEQLEAEVLNLPQAERARLALRLIASLDADEPLERAWYDEAERRLAAVESGRLPEIPADEVLAELGLQPLR
jgi:putative addiction module component (TIGR02574 family)